MTKKDYVKFAQMFKTKMDATQQALDSGAGERATGYSMAIYDIAGDMARIFADDNPLFDSDRFLKACGL
jgi:hypothetical protein